LRKHLEKGGEHLTDIESHAGRGLKSHYQRVIYDWLTTDKLPILRAIFENAIKGNDPSTLNFEVDEDCYLCLFRKSAGLKTSQAQKPQVARRACSFSHQKSG